MQVRAREKLLLIAAFFVPACVVVSSTSRPGPRPDAGLDAPPEMDSGPEQDTGPARAEATRMLLESIGTNVVLPTYRELATEMAALEAAAAVYAASGADTDRDAAREAWSRAMVAVERADLLQFGPAGAPPVDDMEGALGGA
jgi:hypothetical protein